jgi:hypothetical protein
MKKTINHHITVRKLHQDEAPNDFMENHEDCLDLVEQLRKEAGKFLYDYPTTFRRIITVVRRKQS